MNDRVRDWMTKDPVRVREHASALEAFDTMVEHGIRHLPVVAGSHERVVGILSIDDLRGAFPFEVSLRCPLGALERNAARDYRVGDAMTWAPRTAHADMPLDQAARELAEHRIGCMPVVDEEHRLVGLLSETDALRALDGLLRGEPRPAAGGARSDRLLDALRAERDRIVEQLSNWQEAERSLSDEVHDEPRDAGDHAVDEREIATLEPLSERAAGRLRAIDDALERASRGRFGICDRCHGRIPATRLRAIPEATLCVRCARANAGAD